MHSINMPNLEEFQATVRDALVAWGTLGGSEDELLGSLLLVREKRAELGQDHSPLILRQATNEILESCINELAEYDKNSAEVLRARFIEGMIVRQVANKLHASPDQVNRWQRTAINHLSQILFNQEKNRREERANMMEAGLPAPTYSQLFGLAQAKHELIEQLSRKDGPWAIAIAGIGGIGKTALALDVCRQLTRDIDYEQLIWLQIGGPGLGEETVPPEQSFEQLLEILADRLELQATGAESMNQRIAQIRRVLRRSTHLLVIDNLETEEQVEFLLEQTRLFAGPSRIILTTRARPAPTTSVYVCSLDELNSEDATSLLRHQAEKSGLAELSGAKDDIIETIYAITGGNPLALKLVVGLTMVMPLSQILEDLAHSRPGPIEDLYRHIYWEAWRALNPSAQSLLQAMPLVSEAGALPDQMQAISGLTEEAFWTAVTDLAARSLLEVRGTLQERRYGIHRLTETFLRTEIIHWPEE
jgi:hypothetical protein